MGSKVSVSEQLSQARLMAEGIKKRVDVTTKVGLTEDRATQIETLSAALAKADSEQEELKAQLKTKTAEVDEAQSKLNDLLSEAKKLVKIAVDKNDWLTFGISDKK